VRRGARAFGVHRQQRQRQGLSTHRPVRVWVWVDGFWPVWPRAPVVWNFRCAVSGVSRGSVRACAGERMRRACTAPQLSCCLNADHDGRLAASPVHLPLALERRGNQFTYVRDAQLPVCWRRVCIPWAPDRRKHNTAPLVHFNRRYRQQGWQLVLYKGPPLCCLYKYN
jgi:hypothetical protein